MDLWEKLVEPGAILKVKHKIATIAVDGENVPYGQPYSLDRPGELNPGISQRVSQKKERASFR